MATLQPWHKTAQPHRDIREGRLDESVFAANLWQVVQGSGPDLYADPARFFETTHLTRGLAAVLGRVELGFSGSADAGDRILSLQTGFGGGKTHTLIALWHLARQGTRLGGLAPKEVRAAINFRGLRDPVTAAVFTNQTCDVVQGREVKDGLTLRTLWGEIAYQLGGPQLYKLVQPNDAALTTPKGLFAKVLAKAAPCLILIDELADYCSAASAVKVEGSTLGDQTISFMQELTEAVQQTPGAVLVATLPASALEVANSETGGQILSALEKRVGRMGADVKPVADDEIYEVIRRRLFQDVGSPQDHAATIDAYLQMYREHLDEVPPEVLRADYRELMLRSYPFHPSLIQALHTRWGSHPDFQRTRGVLRLLAAIVGDLWDRRNASSQSQPLIQPAHLRFDLEALVGQVTRLFGANYQSVLASDVVGASSNAAKIDSERGGDYASEHLASGLAASIALGSFGGTADHTGWSARDLKLASARPDVNWSYTDGALSALEDRCFYLHATQEKAGKRYWFTAKPTLNKLVLQHLQSVSDDDITTRVTEQLRLLDPPIGTFSKLLVAPSADLPEQKELTLLALAPIRTWGGRAAKTFEKEILALSTLCGKRERVYRNTLLFLAASDAGMSVLRDALRTLLALERIKGDYSGQLDPEQREDLRARTDAQKGRVNDAILDTYSVLLRVKNGSTIEALEIQQGKRGDATKHFDALFKQAQDEGWIITSVGRLTLERAGLWPTTERAVNLKEATEAFLRFTDKEVLAHPKVIANGVSELVRKRVLGIAYGVDPASLSGQSAGEVVAIDPADDSVWIVDIATVVPAVPADASASHQNTSDAALDSFAEATVGHEDSPMYSRVRVSGRVPLESWADVFGSFIRPLANTDLTIRIDIAGEARSGGGIQAKIVDQGGIKEAAKQMGLDVEAA